MKKILFLLLFPTLALAQYQGNANQKITLGEQTTADGLVFRGVASTDTVTATSKITRANKQDTSAYILLDTVTNLLWHYKIGSNAWTQAGGGVSVTSFSAGTTGLTPSTATTGAVTLGGTLAVANGGTGTGTEFTAGSVVFAGASGTYAQDNGGLFYDNTNDRLGIGTASPTLKLDVNGGIKSSYYQFNSAVPGTSADQGFFDYSNGYARFFSIGKSSTPTTKGGFVVRITDANGASVEALIIFPDQTTKFVSSIEATTGKFTAIGSGTYGNILNITSDGTLTTAVSSDENFKYNINPISYGLETILKLKPVSFQWINGDEHDLGFIAQDAVNIIPEAVDTFYDSSLLFRWNTIIPILTKAIQEQNALIKALEQRIINLENK